LHFFVILLRNPVTLDRTIIRSHDLSENLRTQDHPPMFIYYDLAFAVTRIGCDRFQTAVRLLIVRTASAGCR